MQLKSNFARASLRMKSIQRKRSETDRSKGGPSRVTDRRLCGQHLARATHSVESILGQSRVPRSNNLLLSPQQPGCFFFFESHGYRLLTQQKEFWLLYLIDV